MDQKQRQALRVAQLLRDNLLQREHRDRRTDLPEQLWTGVLQLSRRIGRAEDHGWHHASRRLVDDLRREMQILQDQLVAASNGLGRRTAMRAPSAGDIFRDIMALETEFTEVNADPRVSEMCVTTQSIILDGIDLGSFEIHLNLDSIGEPSPYRVVAVEPNPASTNESVTHPHVQDETLCEGEGRTAIRAAVEGGRLYDFFVLVHQILNTYAHGDAYVELKDWHGVPCADCGSLTREDESVSCKSCEDALCGDCAVTCQVCGDYQCNSCTTTCASCDNHVCDSCLARCTKCRSAACSDCLVDGLCTSCHEEEEDDHESGTTTETVEAELAVQSAGLGQVAVSP